MGLDFVALDFETAGLERGTACSIGLVKFQNGKVVDQLEQLLKPVPLKWNSKQQPLESFFHPKCVAVHGISARQVANAPAFWEAWPSIQRFIGALPLVCHNAAFDMGVFRASLDNAGQRWPTLKYGCTLVLSRRTFHLENYRLPQVARAAGLTFNISAHHGAMYDAEIAGKILVSIAAQHGATDIVVLAQKARVRLGQLSPGVWKGCSGV
jgi:DNA polymerase-3 subunit epsilon